MPATDRGDPGQAPDGARAKGLMENEMGKPAAGRAAVTDSSAGTKSDIAALKAKAPEVAEFLRLLANPNRLLLLCHISQGERSVNEIQRDLDLKQPALSQQLAELRQSGLVQTRRESRSIYYAVKDGRARAVVGMLHAIFCGDGFSPPVAASGDPSRPASAAQPGDAATFAQADAIVLEDTRRPRSTP